jgi:putative DNA primase/helicase
VQEKRAGRQVGNALTAHNETGVALDAIANVGWESASSRTTPDLPDLAAQREEPAVTGADGPRPHLVSADTVRERPVRWLWNPYLPLGKIVLLEGDPEVGKTFAALKIVAAISAGAALPYQPDPVAACSAIYMSAEDNPADTLVPRLRAMGSDLHRVKFLSSSIDHAGKELSLSLRDIGMLEMAIEEVRPAVIVIDPIVGFLDRVDTNKATDVRSVLGSLGQLADRHACTILIIRHLAKAGYGKAIYAGQGSVDFVAIARSALLLGKHPTVNGSVMAHFKSNVAERGPSLTFAISDGRFSFGSHVELSADDLLNAPDSDGESSLDTAVNFVRTQLSSGRLPSAALAAEAAKAGIAQRTLDRARVQLRVKSSKVASSWYAELPGDTAGDLHQPL